jgi:hypothetical protein
MTVTTLATQANDVANKSYVDAAAQGLNVHPYCRAASTVAITGTATAGTSDQSQGTGIGATFVYATASYPTIDGVTLVLNDRVLIKNQTDAKQNGIYYVSAAGTNNTLTRATDANNSTAGQVAAGDFVFVDEGTQNNTGWVIDASGTATTPPKGIRIGTDNINFTQFSGAGTYQSGNGLTLTGNSFSINTAITVDTTSTQVLSGKSINGGTNTLTNIPDSALTTVSPSKVTGLFADLAKNPDLLIVGSITRDANDIVSTASVTWIDGSPGTFTTDTINSTYGTIDAYHITYGNPVTKTYYQDAVSRNSNGAVVNVPAIRVV